MEASEKPNTCTGSRCINAWNSAVIVAVIAKGDIVLEAFIAKGVGIIAVLTPRVLFSLWFILLREIM